MEEGSQIPILRQKKEEVFRFPRMNIKQLSKCSILLLLFALCGSWSSKAGYQLHKLYVSTRGSDGNPGTFLKPLATMEKAKSIARRLNGPVTVYLRKGTYYLSNAIVFGPSDSRKTGQELTYMPFQGEKVVISSAAVLRLNWKPFRGKIQQTVVTKDLLFDQLFINGNQQRMARYPNFNPNIKHFGGFAEDALSEARINTWANPEGGYIHSLHSGEWGGFSFRITGKDDKGHLTMEGGYQNNRPSAMHKQIRFVEHIFEELDTAGEYYFDQKSRTLYFYPPAGMDMSQALVETPQLESLFEFRGNEKTPVSNIHLSGLQLTETLRTFMKNKEPLLRSDWTIYRGGAVMLEGAANCSVKSCYFNSVGGNAIFFSNYNRKNEVSGCRIDKAGSSAIAFVGDPDAVRSPLFRYEEFNELSVIDLAPGPRTSNFPSDCLVYNNLIENIGQTEKQVAGVEISMSMNITVRNNTIDNVPRAGINISEGTWGGHLIEGNDVFNTVMETGDHGAFNSWGRDRYWHPDRKKMDSLVAAHPEMILLDMVGPNIIRNNRFRCDHGWDIDLDDGSANYQIYNNVLLNGGLKLREGFYRTVYNNIILNNSFHPHVWFKSSGDTFKNNIVSAAYFPIGIHYWGHGIDQNFFPDSVSLHKAQANGTDGRSIYGNPMFVNVKTGDYQVGRQSPALKTGFKNFPMNRFGVISASLRTLATKVVLPVISSSEGEDDEQSFEFFGTNVKNLNTLGERSATGMDSERGVLVLSVPKTSVLYGKLNSNDVILKFNGKDISKVTDLQKEKMNLQLSHSTSVMVFRNQQLQKLEIALK